MSESMHAPVPNCVTADQNNGDAPSCKRWLSHKNADVFVLAIPSIVNKKSNSNGTTVMATAVGDWVPKAPSVRAWDGECFTKNHERSLDRASF